MFIAVLGALATNDLLPESDRRRLGTYPVGRPGAPLISNLVNEYLRRGHRVLAITTDDQLDPDEPPFVYETDALVYVVLPYRKRIFRPNGRRPGRTADFFRFERRLMVDVLNRYRPDVVHAHWTYEFALAGLAYSPDTVITVHDNARIIFRYVRTLNRFFHLLLARYVFSRGRWFTAVSPYMAESVQAWTAHPVAVVPNPVLLPDEQPHRVVRSRPRRPVVSMVVNGWDERKNPQKALLAFKGLQERHPDAELWAFGTAFTPDGAAAAFCRKHAMPNVTLFGPTHHADVLARVAQSTLLLHASLEESFGMVPAEAMSYGVPVVAGRDSGAVAWVVADGGVLVDVTDVAAMTDGMDRLLRDPALYDQLAANAVRNVETRFPMTHVASQYLALYRQATHLHPAEAVT